MTSAMQIAGPGDSHDRSHYFSNCGADVAAAYRNQRSAGDAMQIEPDEFTPYSGDYSGYIDRSDDPMTVKEKCLLAVLCCVVGFGVGALIVVAMCGLAAALI